MSIILKLKVYFESGMIDKDCSSLIYGIVCQLARDQCYQQSQIDKDEDPPSLKMKWENCDRCWCEKILVLLESKLLTIGTAN